MNFEKHFEASKEIAPELVRYRIVAQRTDSEHPGAVRLTNYAYGRSVEEVLTKVRKVLDKPGGLYGDAGLYRVVEVVEESPDSGVRQRERADLMRLEALVRESVLPRTHPHTTARRRVLEALGEAGGLCTARTRDADGDVIVCTLEAGHYDVDDRPPFKDGKPGGWHKADGVIWSDSGGACVPHGAL
ncbi:hypothetical protein [Streptomyces sp. NPDC021356]|uniref:hypothetical protein n=1 Tax=Streptomyces sp. NPDC021356 TaxID=3154900 RepID=UPI0033E25A45